jgi:hypothetical protein
MFQSGLTLSETVYELILLQIEIYNDASFWDKELTKVVKKFKVSEKILWNLKIQCFCETESWEKLQNFANEKKSPIGYKPFAIACIKYVKLYV